MHMNRVSEYRVSSTAVAIKKEFRGSNSEASNLPLVQNIMKPNLAVSLAPLAFY